MMYAGYILYIRHILLILSNMIRLVFAMVAAISLTACGGKQAQTADSAEAQPLRGPVEASADSLYGYVEQQVGFGPRVPQSSAHEACRNYICNKLKAFGVDTVAMQPVAVENYLGQKLTAYNIFGQINPSAGERILLLAHYDTRPWADEDPDEANQAKPLDGANDGASGVAVMMEIARCLKFAPLDSIGVDLLFVDVEDSGQPGGDNEESWCLGTQKWADNMPYSTSDERPRFGILFDMVGGQGARFNREYLSVSYAKPYVDKIWAMADASGFGSRFPNSMGASVIDDHLYINRAGIPCVDIIECGNAATGSFPPTWHTLDDNLQAIDRSVMREVAQVVLNLLYREDGKL
jgi:hypothetical protein